MLAAVRDAAKANGIWVHLGRWRCATATATGESRLGDRSGWEIVARYDKMHLFDVDLPTGESWRESAVYRAGSDAVVVRGTPVGTLALRSATICAFPAIFERLSEAGAEVIAVPAAFTVPTGKAHWHVLLRARAIEAGLFVVAARNRAA